VLSIRPRSPGPANTARSQPASQHDTGSLATQIHTQLPGLVSGDPSLQDLLSYPQPQELTAFGLFPQDSVFSTGSSKAGPLPPRGVEGLTQGQAGEAGPLWSPQLSPHSSLQVLWQILRKWRMTVSLALLSCAPSLLLPSSSGERTRGSSQTWRENLLNLTQKAESGPR
jgi:hypothetical protein